MTKLTSIKILFRLLVFFCFPFNIVGNWTLHENKMSYNDLVELNATCYPSDSCQELREDVHPEIPNGYSCSCHAKCSLYGTCCIDSPHRDSFLPMLECRSEDGVIKTFGYYLVSKCPDNTDVDSIWKSLCEDEWNEDDDILRIAPVTSQDTNMTYKNIYCLKCHERSDNFLQWDLSLNGDNEDTAATENIEDYIVTYNQANKTWVALSDDKSVSIPVNLDFEFPTFENGTSVPYPNTCDIRIISDCPDSWTDEYIRDKCHAYTALRYREYIKYKNPHCAICNYVSLDDITCHQTVFIAFAAGKDTFSFHHLINLNSDKADKGKKTQKCEENQLWDPYGRMCRKIACALPGYVVRNGRCSRH